MTRPNLSPRDRLVVKVGTTSLVGPGGELDFARVESVCRDLAEVRSSGVEVILVSSGAIAAGLDALGLTSRPSDMPSLQAAAAIGQGRLMRLYTRAFEALGLVTAQMLLTRHDLMQRHEYLNARNTLDRLLALGVVPVVNENDTVATDEIAFGDNDRLAALTANLAQARLLLLLTDAGGLHASDPRLHPDAPLLDEVTRITPEIERLAGGTSSGLGRGGMTSKIAAAWVATFSGVGVVVAHAGEPRVVQRVAAGEGLGTFFHPRPKRESARRLWIAFGQPARGTIKVDEGARSALVERNKSLLAVGVVGVAGDFKAGDTVDVSGPDGSVFARGLARYGATALEGVHERPSDELAGKEVIHRDQLVVLEV